MCECTAQHGGSHCELTSAKKNKNTSKEKTTLV